ncbi:MAG: DUF4126 domain-containing protein [Gammaproteobacteria bacterium]|jgi:hypothetical protein
MEVTAGLALAAGAAWASGINVYAVILVLGLLGTTGYMTLPADLEILMDPFVITAAGLMYCVEFFADKTPGVDTAWDAIHTVIRIPAGAVLAAAALGEMDPAIQIAAFIVGGGLAASSHAAKAGTRVMLNTSPEPVSNWTASIAEDALVVGGLWAALYHPAVFLVLLVAVIGATIWFLPKLWRAIKQLFASLRALFARNPVPEPTLRPGSLKALGRDDAGAGQQSS